MYVDYLLVCGDVGGQFLLICFQDLALKCYIGG